MSSNSRPREPKGVRTGGRWRATKRPEGDIVLSEPSAPDVLVEGRRPRLVLRPSGHPVLVLTTEGEEWAPTPPDGVMPIKKALSLRPSEHGSWADLEQRYRRYESDAFNALVASLRKDGMLTPVEVDPESGVVERGHHRLAAARAAGLKEVPYVAGRRDEVWEWDPRTGKHVPYVYDIDAFDDDDEPGL